MKLFNKNSTSLIVLFLFILNFSITFSLMNDSLFHHDSIVLATSTEQTYQKHTLFNTANGRVGLVLINSIMYFPFWLQNMNADFSTRLSGVLFHSLSIITLFLFINKLISNKVIGSFTALLFSFNPLFISPNTYGKEHGMAAFFLFLSFYMLLSAIEKDKLSFLALASILFVFSIGVRESNLLLIPFFFFLYIKPKIFIKSIIFRKDVLSLKNVLYLIIPFVVLFAIWLRLFLYDLIMVNLFYPTTGSGGVFLGLLSSMLKKAVKDLMNTMPILLWIFILLGFLFLIYNNLKNKNDLFTNIFFFFWTLLIFYFGNTGGYKPRYLDLVLVPLCFFASYFLYLIYKKQRWASFILTIYFVLSMFFLIYPLLEFRHDYSGPKEFALWVQSVIEPNAYIMAIDDAPSLSYYANITNYYNFPLDYKYNDLKLKEWVLNLTKFLDGKNVYVISSAFFYDRDKRILSLLRSNFNLSIAGTKLTEEYHDADVKFTKYNQTLYKITNK